MFDADRRASILPGGAIARWRALALAVAGLTFIVPAQAQPSPRQPDVGSRPSAGRDNQAGCPDLFQQPRVTSVVDRLTTRLQGERMQLTSSQALTLFQRDFAARLRLDLPSSEFTANQRLILSPSRELVERCWPSLGAFFAELDPKTQTSPAQGASEPGESPYDRQRREQADRQRARAEAGRERAAEQNARSSNDYSRFVERQQQEREERERERQAQAEVERQRADAERERRAELARRRAIAEQEQAAERERLAEEARARRAEDTRRAEVADRERAAERQRLAEEDRVRRAEAVRRAEVAERERVAARQRFADEQRKEQEARAAATAEAEARFLEQQKQRAEAERVEAEQRRAERLKRPECREADRAAREEAETFRPTGGTPSVFDMANKFRAGMHAEACAVARKLYTSAERLRSTAARCEPLDATEHNELATGVRQIILDQGC